METKKKFVYFTQLWSNNRPGQFQPTDAADVTFVNIGNTPVTINQVPLNLGDSMLDSAFGDELNTTKYTIIFADAIDCRLIIKSKTYEN
jgi:hypothetical protein